MKRLLIGVLALAACSTKKIDQCSMDSDCVNPTFPFCDVNGEYPASGGDTNVCTPVPADCPPERCGCTPGAETCESTALTVCNADGKSATTTDCVLGCASDGTRCANFAPSNGLGGALGMADGEPDVDLPTSVLITDAGDITDMVGGQHILVKTLLVAQVGVPAIRVFIAQSFKIHAATVISVVTDGGNPIAFVASGPIIVDGLVDAGVPVHYLGPGHQASSAPCAGAAFHRGGGGGGNATVGGNGAPNNTLPPTPGALGGPAQPASVFEPLVGGCPGGGDGTNSVGGTGGGAFEIVSTTSITIAHGGTINVGGAGGGDNGGGGSGGNVLLEAPMVSIVGNITANGGSGGACGLGGNVGTADASPAPAVGGCDGTNGVMPAMSGSGGTATQAPTAGTADVTVDGAAGGGAVGRLEIKTIDGMYSRDGAAIISAAITALALEPQ